MKLYADEDIDRALVDALRQDHDVVFVSEGAHRTLSDAWHLMQARLEGRILLTFNHTDYRFLHRVWTSAFNFDIDARTHGGILTATRNLPAVTWLPPVRDVLSRYNDLYGRLLVWHDYKRDWVEDAWRPETSHTAN